MKNYEMPVGFSMALALNSEAMQKFAMADDSQKQKIIDGAHNIKSKDEMKQYINSLTE